MREQPFAHGAHQLAEFGGALCPPRGQAAATEDEIQRAP